MKLITANVTLGYDKTVSGQWGTVEKDSLPYLVYHPNLPDNKIALIKLDPSRIQLPAGARGVPAMYSGVIGPDDHSLTICERADFADQLPPV